MPLNDKIKRFADEYLVDFNGTQAAIRAGYSKKTAYAQANSLLKKPEVQEYLKTKKKKVTEALEHSQRKTLTEIARVAFSDIRLYFNDDGSLKPISELNDTAAAALSSCEIRQTQVKGTGKTKNKTVVHIGQIKLYDKIRALEMLAKHYHIFEEIDPNREQHNHFDLSKLSKEDLKLVLQLVTQKK